jgi:hypothetical protein
MLQEVLASKQQQQVIERSMLWMQMLLEVGNNTLQ